MRFSQYTDFEADVDNVPKGPDLRGGSGDGEGSEKEDDDDDPGEEDAGGDAEGGGEASGVAGEEEDEDELTDAEIYDSSDEDFLDDWLLAYTDGTAGAAEIVRSQKEIQEMQVFAEANLNLSDDHEYEPA